MGERYAHRVVTRCNKDCLCLYVCPTGASDTENSIIDKDKCVGCGACADACPAGAIILLPREYPPQQEKKDAVAGALLRLAQNKVLAGKEAAGLPGPLAEALQKSSQIMAEDLFREACFMLPQGKDAYELLGHLSSFSGEEGFPKEALEFLLSQLGEKK